MSITPFDIRHIHEIMLGENDWFTAKLLRLMRDSDTANLERLGSVYPDVFAHFCVWKYGNVPTRFSHIDSIREYVNSHDDINWQNSEGRVASLVLLTNGKDF